MRRAPLGLAVLGLAVLVLASTVLVACADEERPQLADDPTTTTGEAAPGTTGGPGTTSAAAETPTTQATTTTVPGPPPAPNGRRRPVPAPDPAGLARQIAEAERGVRDPATPPAELPALGHLQQVAYRQLGAHPEWLPEVLAAVPEDLRPVVEAHARARGELSQLHTAVAGKVPAWEIVEPLPAVELRAIYDEAQAAYGIPWQYLAAINLVETGMGRIRGLSIAGAQGPMQFIPATWEAYGEGDVNDPHDAILAAARYLDARGGPEDMAKALYGYNPSDHYVTAVSTYADLMAADERAYLGFHSWEIHYASSEGDLWLPVGTRIEEALPVADFLAANPWSAPPDPGP